MAIAQSDRDIRLEPCIYHLDNAYILSKVEGCSPKMIIRLIDNQSEYTQYSNSNDAC
jgi:hypothetical protein